ncbi:LOW QUALITY PROTEIN: hypothetical protein V2J09_017945 [Rumex salicifolius]
MKLTNPTNADELVWFPTKDGYLSVSSTYQMFLQKEIVEETEGASFSSSGVELPTEETLALKCSADVPSYGGLIATFFRQKVNLCWRGVTPDNRCEKCGRPKTEIHVVMQSPSAAEFWHDSPSLLKLDLREESMWNRYVNVNNFLPTELELWALMCSNVWNARNKRIFKGVKVSPVEMILNYKEMLLEFQASKF